MLGRQDKEILRKNVIEGRVEIENRNTEINNKYQ